MISRVSGHFKYQCFLLLAVLSRLADWVMNRSDRTRPAAAEITALTRGSKCCSAAGGLANPADAHRRHRGMLMNPEQGCFTSLQPQRAKDIA